MAPGGASIPPVFGNSEAYLYLDTVVNIWPPFFSLIFYPPLNYKRLWLSLFWCYSDTMMVIALVIGDGNVNGSFGDCDGVKHGACSDGVVGGSGVILSNQG